MRLDPVTLAVIQNGLRHVASRTVDQTMNGMSTCAVKFTCALACDSMAGAKPQNAPPTAAPIREPTTWRKTQYQPAAVQARPSVMTVT